jgi:hypothetical protein
VTDGIREHTERLKDCILNVIVGEKLGRGQFRTVYALDDDRVLKVETANGAFCNVHEHAIWEEVKDHPELKHWFAPCLGIDEYGAALVMRRTTPMTDRQWKALKQVPDVMCDLKRENWGMLDGKPVAHDYGNHLFFAKATRKVKLKDRGDD